MWDAGGCDIGNLLPYGAVSPTVMGIINITPDSFSDGGELYTTSLDLDKTLVKAHEMVEAGAGIIDVGGESTRPGASEIGVEEELNRIIPVVEALTARFDTPISVDTSSSEVIVEAASAGARLINDVRALRRPGAIEAAVKTDLPVCLVHMQNEPASMQVAPTYKDVVAEVKSFLLSQRNRCLIAGIPSHKILIDPGFGFGKTTEHNLCLFKAIDQFVETNIPVLIGVSRKRFIGELLNEAPDQRLIGSVTMAVLAAQAGASILRVHDVKETKQALRLLSYTESLSDR